jgi:serine/threonine protein phosphatase PrpC
VTPSTKTLPDGSHQFGELELHLEAAAATDAGRVRESNEDVYGIYPDERLFVVADGMGGRAAGEIAARIAIDVLEAFCRENRNSDPAAWPYPANPGVARRGNMLRVGLKVANRQILDESRKDPSWYRMGTTIAVLSFDDDELVAAHAGDVRIYRFRRGVAARLTRDHSLAEEMRAARPNLPPDQMAAILKRNVITRSLGNRPDVEPTVYLNSYLDGDMYLLCSDGLWSCVPDDLITAIVTSEPHLENACHALIDAANRAGAPDNVTALLVRVER